MRIGINASSAANDLDAFVAAARRAEEAGFDTVWLSQVFGIDALTALAVAGASVGRIEMGTAVTPTYPRHPMMMAGQALTVQQATDGRLVLGIGLSHRIVIEDLWGYSYDRPLRHMREYLDALLPLLADESVNVHGEDVTAVGALEVRAAAPEVVIAALGTNMLRLAGSRGCGTITWCTGERTLAEHIVPTITAAAQEAGRQSPRVVATLPIILTSDRDAAHDSIAEQMVIYGGLPSYRAMLDREGVEGPADVAIIGDEAHLSAALDRLESAGVTDFAALIVGGESAQRAATWDLLADRVGG